MKRTFVLGVLILLTLLGRTQSLEGTYVALELISLTTDTSGTVNFYMKESLPAEVWFHEVTVIIKNNQITVDKSPVMFDSGGRKIYSASEGGFWTYHGMMVRSGDCFVAKTRLVAFDYVGFTLFEPPQFSLDEIPADTTQTIVGKDTTTSLAKSPSVKELRQTHDVVKGVHGVETFLPKGSARQDYIIRPGKGGIWINNKFYQQMQKLQAHPSPERGPAKSLPN